MEKNGDCFPDVGEFQCADVYSVEKYLSFSDVVDPCYQVENGTLSGAVFSNNNLIMCALAEK